MSERWWRRHRKRSNPRFGDDFFEETDRLEEIMRRVLGRNRQRDPFVYGFSMTIGEDGKPQIREFANTQTGLSGQLGIREESEPLVDVFECGDEFFIVAEVPGVNKDDIQIRPKEDSVTISVDTPQRGYYKELALTLRIDPKSMMTSCKNGVLELHLKKAASERVLVK